MSDRITALAAVLVAIASGCVRTEPEPMDLAPPAASAAPAAAPTAGPAPFPQPIGTEDMTTTNPTAGSDGGLEMAVEDAVLLALSNNRDLAVRRYDPVIAATFAEIERGVYDPEVFAGVRYEEERVSETDRATGTLFNVESEARTVEAGVRQRLATGTDVQLEVSQQGEDSSRTPEQEETRVGLTVTQALARGFGPQVNLAAVRQAQLDAAISRFELQGFTEALLAEVEIAYWRLAQAEERVRLLEEAVRVAQLQREDTRTRIELGAAPASDAAATESSVAGRRQALIAARADRQQARLRLLQLTTPDAVLADEGFEADFRLLSVPAGDAPPQADIANRIALAHTRRADLGEARLRLQQRRLATTVTANGTLPRLDFFLQLGKTGYGERVRESFDNLDGDTWDYTVGIDFSYSLGGRSADARHAAAVAGRRQALAAIDNLERVIAFDVRRAWNDVQRAADLLAAARTTARLQRGTVAAEEARLEAGASTTLLVAQVRRDLLETEVSAIDAAADYAIALVTLYRIEGSLLARRGINLFAGGQRQR